MPRGRIKCSKNLKPRVMTPEMLEKLAHARAVLSEGRKGRGTQIRIDTETADRLDKRFGSKLHDKRAFASHAIEVALNRAEGKDKAAEKSGE